MQNFYSRMLQTSLNSLTEKTDKQLVRMVKGGSSEAFEEICRRYENIFYKVCQKYATTLSLSGINPEDIFEEKNFIIFHCIKTYNADKNTKLSTWIGNFARYLCLNTLNSRKFILPTATEELNRHIEETQQRDVYFRDNYSADNFSYITNILDQLKDTRIKEIINLRYFSDTTPKKKMIWEKIAKKLNMSTQTAINLHNKGLDLLRSKMQSKNISDVV